MSSKVSLSGYFWKDSDAPLLEQRERRQVKLSDHCSTFSLTCPHCGHTETHQGDVEVFNRVEDAATGVHVAIKGNSVVVDGELAENPSDRRHGVLISVLCEADDKHVAKLAIYQHKGTTFIEWIMP